MSHRLPMSDRLMIQVLAGVKTETRRPEAKYGSVHSTLIFTEAHRMEPAGGYLDVAAVTVCYRADGKTRNVRPDCDARVRNDKHWQPPMFMPPWAARARGVCVELSPEKLHDMNMQAVATEGVLADAPNDVKEIWASLNPWAKLESLVGKADAQPVRDYMRARWDEIYGAKPGMGWDSNPTVWKYRWELAGEPPRWW